jgi:hypothetical protein
LNQDGYVSKSEMAQFIKGYVSHPAVTDGVSELTLKIFAKYDYNRSGYLDKKECLAMLDEVLDSRGQQKTSLQQFNRFYAQYDLNGDGLISKQECERFVKKFVAPAKRLTIGLVQHQP